MSQPSKNTESKKFAAPRCGFKITGLITGPCKNNMARNFANDFGMDGFQCNDSGIVKNGIQVKRMENNHYILGTFLILIADKPPKNVYSI